LVLRVLLAIVAVGAVGLSIGTAGKALLSEVSGAFEHAPQDMADGLSPGARSLLDTAFEDVSPDELVDHHVHVLGLGTNGSGAWVNPKMLEWSDPIQRIKGLVYLSGADIQDMAVADEQYLARLVDLSRNGSAGQLLLLGFDYRHDANGNRDLEHSEFYTPNRYVFELAQMHPGRFAPAISVHPHRADAVAALHAWADRGVRFVKWLPNAMGIDASLERHDSYYRALIERRMVLLTHVGEEQAVEAEADQRLGNPLLFRRPLDLGVSVVMAHVASLGSDADLDRLGEKVPSFELFLRLMDEQRYAGRLYGEISAITQVNRLPAPLITLLSRSDLHHRLMNGSDYPLPAINVVIQTRALVKHGLIEPEEREWLNEIYDYNPLLFDYALKRTLRHPETGTQFPISVFRGDALGGSLLREPARQEPSASAHEEFE
jgi:predicted TIM-barrel fold metal-dependent hydrolase